MSDATIYAEDVGVSATVRALARDARRILTDPSREAAEVAGLTRRIRRMREQQRVVAGSPLQRWLDQLQRRVDGLGVERAAS